MAATTISRPRPVAVRELTKSFAYATTRTDDPGEMQRFGELLLDTLFGAVSIGAPGQIDPARVMAVIIALVPVVRDAFRSCEPWLDVRLRPP